MCEFGNINLPPRAKKEKSSDHTRADDPAPPILSFFEEFTSSRTPKKGKRNRTNFSSSLIIRDRLSPCFFSAIRIR